MKRFISISLLSLFSHIALADMCGNTTPAASQFTLIDQSFNISTGLGYSGYSMTDIDSDSYPEVVFGTGYGFGINTSFVIAEFDDSDNKYHYLCQSAVYDSGIYHIRSFSNSTVTHGSIIALGDGKLEIIDHKLGYKVYQINAGPTQIKDLLVADADNDGKNEIVVLMASATAIYDIDTFELESTLPYGGSQFAIGHFTAAGANEIAYNGGKVIHLSNTSTVVKWDYSLGFSNYHLDAGDIDGDGLDEIVGADAWYKIRTFNADTKGIAWEYSTNLDIDGLKVADVSGDNIADVLYADGQHGSTYALNGSTHTLLWTTGNLASGVTSILVGNLDNDAGIEIMRGVGYGTTGPDYLVVYDAGSKTQEWVSGENEGPYYAVAFGDIDGDGVTDRAYASLESESGYGSGIVTAISGSTGEILWKTTSNTLPYTWTGVHALVIGDVDNDGANEVVVGTDLLYDGYIHILNPVDGSIERSFPFEDGSPIYSLLLVDLNKDGKLEILAGGGMEHTGSNGIFVYQVDGASGSIIRTYPQLPGSWFSVWSLATADIDNDESLEIIAIADTAYIIDPDNNSLAKAGDTLVSLAVTTDIFTGNDIVYAGNDSGSLVRLSSLGSTTLVANLCAASIDALETVSPLQLAFTCEGRLGTYDIVGQTVQWQLETSIDNQLGLNDSMRHVYDSGRHHLLLGGQAARYFAETTDSPTAVPVASPMALEQHFNTSLQGQLSAEDLEGNPLTYAIYEQPAHGKVTITDKATGAFTYQPSQDFIGEVTFRFYASNGTQVSGLATVTINLTNTAPTGSNATTNNHWNKLYLGQLPGNDADNDTLTYEIVSWPTKGALVLHNENTGEFSYFNNSPDIGQASFTYRVSDSASMSTTYSYTINLTNTEPQAPRIELETYYITDIYTLAGGYDADADTLSYEITTAPAIGQATLSPFGLLNYTPAGENDYSVVLQYRTHDGKTWSAPGEIAIKVYGAVTTYTGDAPVYIDQLSNDIHAGLAPLTTTASLLPTGGSGNYVYLWDFGDGTTSSQQNPAHTFNTPGEYTVSVKVADSMDTANFAKGYFKVLVAAPLDDLVIAVTPSADSKNPLSITLDILVSGSEGPFDVIVDFGDDTTDEFSSTSQGFSVEHTYSAANTYSISVFVQTGNGATATKAALKIEEVEISGSEDGNHAVNRESSGGGMISPASLLLMALMLLLRQRYRTHLNEIRPT